MRPKFSLEEAIAEWKPFAPNIVSALLGAAIVLQIALPAASMNRRAREPDVSRPNTGAYPARESSADVSGIIQAHLFGEVEAASASADAPESQLPLTLAATFAKEDPRHGLAIIGDTGQAGRLYATGESVAGAAVLAEVFPDSVVLDRNGVLEKLTLRTRTAIGGAVDGAERVAQQAGLPPRRMPAAPPSPADVDSNAPVPMKSFVLMPVFANRQAGARIGQATNPAVLAKAGLKSGDIITAINGAPVHGMHAAANLINAAAGGALTLTIMRGGNREDVQVESLD